MNYQTFIKKLGFKLKNRTKHSYYKKYGDYEIIIKYNENNINTSTVDYGKSIKIERGTILNLSKTENLVILECINRLLEKGYKPENIELEKKWALGHKGKGFLDIFVKDENRNSFLMIECKTWGHEYEKEKKNTLTRAQNQIFSYLQQEPKTTKAICLYTCNINTLQYSNAIVYNKEEWKDLNQIERYSRWVAKFEDQWHF